MCRVNPLRARNDPKARALSVAKPVTNPLNARRVEGQGLVGLAAASNVVIPATKRLSAPKAKAPAVQAVQAVVRVAAAAAASNAARKGIRHLSAPKAEAVTAFAIRRSVKRMKAVRSTRGAAPPLPNPLKAASMWCRPLFLCSSHPHPICSFFHSCVVVLNMQRVFRAETGAELWAVRRALQRAEQQRWSGAQIR
jgi:hypothetical protein